MKKYLFPAITSLTIGITMSYFLINSYDSQTTIAAFKKTETVYYIQKGVYSNKENMENNMTNFTHYIYNVEENMYYTYIGITKNKKNSEKLQEFYKQKGYDTYIKEKTTDNEEFLTILGQYDEIISQTDDENTLQVVCNQILSKYEEMVNNEY